MNFRLTAHAETVIAEREISQAWIAVALDAPEQTEDMADGTRHHLARIAERDNRVLRVVVEPTTDPVTVVTVFLDRRMRGRLP